jgi:hypothetical protein
VFVELDTRHPSEPASGFLAVRRDRARAVFGQAMGLVALTVGCLALGAYMGRDLTGGAGLALSVGAVICLLGLNSARSPRATPARRAPLESATRIAHRAQPRDPESGVMVAGARGQGGACLTAALGKPDASVVYPRGRPGKGHGRDRGPGSARLMRSSAFPALRDEMPKPERANRVRGTQHTPQRRLRSLARVESGHRQHADRRS